MHELAPREKVANCLARRAGRAAGRRNPSGRTSGGPPQAGQRRAAFVYNALMVPVAAGVLSAVGMHISPIWGSAAMSLSSLSVVGNALRLRRVRL
jgi:hypothetical protein